MIKTYSYKRDKDKYCSKHTQVKEFASKRGNKLYTDTVLIDDTLIDRVEKLFTALNCSKYVISSGYRTPEHDKAVGGNGKGQHTKGKAVDACFYDKSGKVIPAPYVCCVAQDLGFKGIANISKNYRYVHLDMRSSGKYYGDETKGYNTVTNDFYKYFNISKAQVEKYTGANKTITQIAKEVIAGKWGNGYKRKKALAAANYDYAIVQKEVNKILKEKGANGTY